MQCILDKIIPLYTVNHPFKTIIKNVVKHESSTAIAYDGADSNPLYISFKTFKTFSETEQNAATSESEDVKKRIRMLYL